MALSLRIFRDDNIRKASASNNASYNDKRILCIQKDINYTDSNQHSKNIPRNRINKRIEF